MAVGTSLDRYPSKIKFRVSMVVPCVKRQPMVVPVVTGRFEMASQVTVPGEVDVATKDSIWDC